jgi:predicted unusual protein kinase regulating ubiquinone biosynthesis (AarF/ABC1/UbiB family)
MDTRRERQARHRGNLGSLIGKIGKSIGSIPTDLLLVGRALGLLAGITRQLDPAMDTLEIVAHYI